METKLSLKQQIANIRSIADYTSLGVSEGKSLKIRAFEFLNQCVLTIPTNFSVLSKDVDNHYLDEQGSLHSFSDIYRGELKAYSDKISSHYHMSFSYDCYEIDGCCLYTAKMYAGDTKTVKYYNGRYIRCFEFGKLAATLYALADLVEK